MVTDRQVKRLMRLLRMGKALAAAKADMDYKSILHIQSWLFSNSRPIFSNNYKVFPHTSPCLTFCLPKTTWQIS